MGERFAGEISVSYRFIEDFSLKQLTEFPFFFDIFWFYLGAGVIKNEEMAMYWFR